MLKKLFFIGLLINVLNINCAHSSSKNEFIITNKTKEEQEITIYKKKFDGTNISYLFNCRLKLKPDESSIINFGFSLIKTSIGSQTSMASDEQDNEYYLEAISYVPVIPEDENDEIEPNERKINLDFNPKEVRAIDINPINPFVDFNKFYRFN